MPHIAYHLLRHLHRRCRQCNYLPMEHCPASAVCLGYEARKHGLCWLPESQIWSIPRRGFSLHILLIRIRNSFQFDSSASSLLEITDNLDWNLVRILRHPHREFNAIKLLCSSRPVILCSRVRFTAAISSRIRAAGKSHGKCCTRCNHRHQTRLCEHLH